MFPCDKLAFLSTWNFKLGVINNTYQDWKRNIYVPPFVQHFLWVQCTFVVQYEANCIPLSLSQWFLDATALYCYTFMPNILHTVYLTTCSQSADYMQKFLHVTTVCCQCTHHCQHTSNTEQLVKFDIGLFFHSLQSMIQEASSYMLKCATHRADDNTGSFLVLQWGILSQRIVFCTWIVFT